MGVYVYTVRKSEKRVHNLNGEKITVHALRYLSKPYFGWGGVEDKFTKMHLAKCENTWENHEGPIYAVLLSDEDTMGHGGIIYKMTSPVWWDTDLIGEEVGFLPPSKKVRDSMTSTTNFVEYEIGAYAKSYSYPDMKRTMNLTQIVEVVSGPFKGLIMKRIVTPDDNGSPYMTGHRMIQTQHLPRLMDFFEDEAQMTYINEDIGSVMAKTYHMANHHQVFLKDMLLDETQRDNIRRVKRDGMALKDIQEQTEQLCLVAVKQYGLALQFVKNPTKKIYLEAVRQNGWALQHVSNQTEDICLEAVRQDGRALKFVKNQTDKICLEAVKQNPEAFSFVQNQTEDICLEAVKKDGKALKNVENRTQAVCIEAVKNNGYAIKFVPDEFLTQDLCLIAVTQRDLENPLENKV